VKHVLVVDDNSLARSALGRLLERLGYAVHVAASFESAEAFLETIQLDAVVTDYRLAGRTGRDLLYRVRRVSEIPVILYTGIDIDCGDLFSAAVEKPNSDDLAAHLERLCPP
jgi:CheY-like chemotaxis protein